MLRLLRKIIPKPLFQLYHYTLAKASAFLYGHPSNRLRVIGVTGTNGKSSTVQFIAQMLETMDETVGYTTTAGFNIGGVAILNKMKMTMPGRFYLQALLRRMVKQGCTYAVIETSSQGIEQFRHLGINYDVAVFTNLTPEHLESHGGFEAYKAAKGKLFAHMANAPRKQFDGRPLKKVSVINANDPHADFYASFPVDHVLRFDCTYAAMEAQERSPIPSERDQIHAEILAHDATGTQIRVQDMDVHLPLMADFQVKNALAAIAALVGAGKELSVALDAAEQLQPIPGRFELVDEGQDFSVVIDYAYEPYALTALFSAAKALQPKRIIGVHGSAGGGRDVARRPVIGRMAAQNEAVVIVTNEDPYDEDPRMIIEQVAQGAIDAGKKEGKDLLLINDREEAVRKAIGLARTGDMVLLTGKGNEPVIAGPHGRKIPWSDVAAAKRALKERSL